MPTAHSRLRLLAVVAAIVAVVGLGVVLARRAPGATEQTSAGQPASPQPAATVATVDGQPITAAELDAALGTSLSKLEQELYDLKKERLDAMIAERLLQREAARRGIEMKQLVAQEITGKVAPATDQEVDAFYEANKARLPNAPDIKAQIKQYLGNQRAQARSQAYVQELRQQAKVEVTLPAPPVRRTDVNIDGAPIRGPKTAPVTVVEFSDFHCPFCKRVQPTLLQLLAKYPEQVRLVYKDLPLDSLHPQARRASEAARCAGDQGKFWEYHDKLYEGGPDTSPEYLKKLATDVSLDVAAFDQCLADGRHKPGIQSDLEQASRLGLSGTPAFFINGRALSGALPFEQFVKVVDEELSTGSK
jgi:protein-disulfide isomerase